jgi:SAM-dependent methyltransferase
MRQAPDDLTFPDDLGLDLERRVATFPWPRPRGASTDPVWTGTNFIVAERERPVLCLQANTSGWDQGLTHLHEEEAGTDHFIDIASRRQALEHVRRFLPRPDAVVMEVGCSSGFFLLQLKAALPQAFVMGSDSFPESLTDFARGQPGIPLLQFDLTSCPLPDACVDAVVLLNVLEHIEDDRKALAQLFRILKPQGVVVIEVPAGSDLYDTYDELLRHYRRYDHADLVAKAQGAGFEVVRSSHLGFFLYPAFRLVKKLNKRRLARSTDQKKEQVATTIAKTRHNRPMELLMRLEYELGRFVTYPWGIRHLLVARKL